MLYRPTFKGPCIRPAPREPTTCTFCFWTSEILPITWKLSNQDVGLISYGMYPVFGAFSLVASSLVESRISEKENEWNAGPGQIRIIDTAYELVTRDHNKPNHQ